MYKDKGVNKNVKNIFLSLWRKIVFDIYFTEFGTALTTISEQSDKGKVKTYKYINRQNQSTTGKLWKP
jgi:hypothetical protein